ncbi:hypothetical protein GQX74_009345 [Glossina fuscipes]|nr:hypothetical protein GQX74_009345 [Glossina fuscipes]
MHLQGAIKSVVYTDAWQVFVMFWTVITVVIIGIVYGGGFGPIGEAASEGGRLIFPKYFAHWFNWQRKFIKLFGKQFIAVRRTFRREQTSHANNMFSKQGQEIHARKLVSNCLEDGGWVLLQNCHLGLDYMNGPTLLLLDLERGEKSAFSKNFRVWITTEPRDSFSITSLKMFLKFTNESPARIRAGLKRTYSNLPQDFPDYSQSAFDHPLVFAIFFLHSGVQERRKFGPLR